MKEISIIQDNKNKIWIGEEGEKKKIAIKSNWQLKISLSFDSFREAVRNVSVGPGTKT